jgi:uncharacterized protein YodC (DUF2158 family)
MNLQVGSVVRLNSSDKDGPRLTIAGFSEYRVMVAWHDSEGLHTKELRREMLTEAKEPLPKCAICGSVIVAGACTAWIAGKNGCPAAAAYREHEREADAAASDQEEPAE